MRLVRKAALLNLVAGAAAFAAPPPPPVYPKGQPTVVDGYRMESIYPIYFSWLNRSRDEALESALTMPQQWHGLRSWQWVVESKIDSYDFGTVRIDRLARYCEGNWINDDPPGRCDYLYRYAIVPGSAWNDPRTVKAIEESFRPVELARRLAGIGWKHGDDWTDKALRSEFEKHTSAKAVFAPLVRTVEVSASSCPALASGMAALGGVSLSLASGAVTDPVDAPAPHGARTRIRLAAADRDGRAIILEGATPLYGHLRPIWNAVDDCSDQPK